MKVSQRNTQLKVLKHLAMSKPAIAKAKMMNITEEHFFWVDEGQKINYMTKIFGAIMYQFDQSNSLLTANVLDHLLVEKGAKDKLKGELLVFWETVQEADYDENELHILLRQLKTDLALTYWRDLHVEGHKIFEEKGIDAAAEWGDAYLKKIRNQLQEIEGEVQTVDFSAAGEYLEKEYAKRLEHADLYKGVSCGLSNIDEKTFGWMSPQLVVLLAPSSGGKSVQMLNWAHAAHLQGKNVLYFSFEMDAWLCILRHVSLAFQVPYSALKSLKVPPDELKDIVNKMKGMEGGPYFEYEVNMEDPTPEFVDARIRELIFSKGRPDLVVIDYIGNMTTRNSASDAKPWEKQGDAVRELFILAKRHQIPILTAQQMNRDTIRENRKNKAAGKSIEMYQDAASGDQRLIHYAHYVIGMEPDKENSMVTYYPVKMRDAWFQPFGAKWVPEYNMVSPLNEDEQQAWRMQKGLYVASSTSVQPDSPVSTNIDERGSVRTEWEGGAVVNTADDFVMTLDDLSLDDMTPWGDA